MLPSVSVPTPIAARLAAIAVPVPELDPHGLRSSTYGILRLPAARAPARRRSRRAEVGPLAEVGLAEDHRAGVAQPLDHERIRAGTVVGQRQRAGRVHHAGDVDVVLDQHRNAVHRAAHLAGLALGVERVRIGDGLGIELDHRIQLRPGIVDLRDAIEVRLASAPRTSAAPTPSDRARRWRSARRRRGRAGGWCGGWRRVRSRQASPPRQSHNRQSSIDQQSEI